MPETKSSPRVLFQPAVGYGFKRGIDLLVDAIRPTLGPLPRTVMLPRPTIGSPEILDNGGVIARRLFELPDRDADAGAMFLRHLLWQQHEREGDGTATAAVLFQAIYDGGLAYVAAGGNAMQLRRRLEEGGQLLLDALGRQTVPVEGQEVIERVALAVCGDPGLADRLGEIFDIIGEYGWFEVRTGRGRDLEREYVEGVYWEGGALSWQMVADQPKARAELAAPAIFISDIEFETPEQLVPVLRAAMQAGHQAVVIVARKIADRAMNFLLANRRPAGDPESDSASILSETEWRRSSGERMAILAVKCPGAVTADWAAALEDLAYLTGGQPFAGQARADLNGLTAADLGRARIAWATKDYFGIIGGRGDPRGLRGHIMVLRQAHARIVDPAERKRIRARIGKLMGGSATLWLAGATDSEVKFRADVAERTAEAVRGALIEGALPGGGVALLACRGPLADRLAVATDHDERAALRILLTAVERPFRTLARNAGYEPAALMAALDDAGPGFGFDVAAGQVVEMAAAGLLDPASVQKGAAWRAVTGAALALTTDALVQHKHPQKVFEP